MLKSNEHWKSLVEALPDHVMILGMDYSILEINHTLPDLSKEKVIGKSVLEFVPSDYHHLLIECFKRVLHSGNNDRYETKYISTAGVTQYFEARVSPIKDEHGNIISFISSSNEITERKQLELERNHLLHDMGERIKELNCLYEITEAFRTRNTLDEVFLNIIRMIPPGWHYPEYTTVRICFDGKDYFEAPFEPTEWKQTCDIIIGGESRGTIEVYYTKEFPSLDEGPFLKEERHLINGISKLMSEYIERKQAEEELRKNDDKYQGIFNESVTAIYVFDQEKNFIDSNQAGLDLLGYSREELLNMNIPDVDADQGAVVPAHRHLLSGGRIVNFEHRLVHKNGHIITVLNNSRPLTDTAGEVTGRQSTLIDITERKKAEEELRASKELFSLFMDYFPANVFIKDEKSRTLFVNKYMDDVFGAKEWIGKTPLELFPKKIGEAMIVDDKKTLAEEYQRIEETVPDKYGTDHIYQTHKFSIKRSGKPPLLGGIALEITELKEVEMEQVRMQKELHQAQKMESLGHLTGGIAHDFNNLLGIINGYAGLAQDILLNQGESKLTEYVRNIHEAGARATTLVAQMLSFSRGDQTENIPIQFAPLIKDEIKMLRSTLPSTIKIKSHIDLNLPDVLMNPTQLHQILMNLSINARDAMNGVGELTIRLKMAHDLDIESTVSHKPIQGDWIELCVSDTGSGIDSETIKDIFNPFFTTKEVGKGTGMGLSVIYRIMEDHGGHILLDSELGKGSTFSMLFPPLIGDSINLSGLEQEPVEIPEGDGSEILVVDDEPMLAVHMSELVKNHGYEASMVTDSIEALEIFRQDPDRFSMLITDQTMPKMTGAELISELRKIRPELPVIMCSGFSDKIDPKGASELNIFYIEKPVDVKKLLLKIPDLLNENSSDIDG